MYVNLENLRSFYLIMFHKKTLNFRFSKLKRQVNLQREITQERFLLDFPSSSCDP